MEVAMKKEFLLDGLSCPVCAGKIASGVRKLAGVDDASVDFSTQRLVIAIAADTDIDGVVQRAGAVVRSVEPGVEMSEKRPASEARKTVYLHGLCCADCATRIERRVTALDGVKSVSVDVMAQKMTVEAHRREQLPAIVREASRIAREIEPDIRVSMSEQPITQSTGPRWKTWGYRVALCTGAALFVVGILTDLPRQAAFALFLASYLLVGGEVVWRALKNIARGQIFDENFLMSVATIGAFAIGEYPEGVAVMLFYQVGEAFQRMAVNRSRKSITSLMDIRPDFANLQTADGVCRVSPEEVGVGETILVRPGEKVPLDGVVTDGYSAVDTSALTGESMPRDIAVGDEVLSGSINQSGLLTVEVTKEFGQSTVSKILDLVQSASSSKAPMENFITKFARYYTPVVVFAALALAVIPPLVIPGALWAEWINRALVFLVVSCPCALVISIPLSYFGGIGGASRNGILIKGSNFLEALNRVDTVVFDKTGTLTKGVFQVSDIQARGHTQEALLEIAAYAESNSNHPIAQSIRRSYGQPVDLSRLDSYEELAGLGLCVKVDGRAVLAGNSRLMEQQGVPCEKPDALGTVVHLAVDGVYAGYIVIADEVKPDSAQAIRDLKAAGVRRTVMLTGDTTAVGERIAREIGLDDVRAELLPQQKVEQLEALEADCTGSGALVYVGDGINDAPVLARSDIGIAMGGVGSDAAIEAADIVLMTDEPSKIVSGIRIAQKTRRIVLQNVIFALGIKAVILVLGALGIATMWEAVFGDVGVAVIAILNATRAMRTVK